MQIDKSVNNFVNDPQNYLLNIKSTKDGRQILTADKKGVFTWLKAHFPGSLFGNYNLKQVAASLNNKVTPELRNAVNSVIIKYKLVHPKTEIQILKNENSKISKNQIIGIAHQKFVNHELKDAILKRIDECLMDYDDSSKSTTNLGLGWIMKKIDPPATENEIKVENEVILFFSNNRFPGLDTAIQE